MSLILKHNCTGLDCEITKAQKKIYQFLLDKWQQPNWECFPRIYKNKRYDEKNRAYFVPEFLQGVDEYQVETLFNDRFDAVSYFLEGDKVNVNKYLLKSKVSFVFSCNIDRLFPDSANKEDMKLRDDFLQAFFKLTRNWTMTEIKHGVDQCFSEFMRKELDWSSMSKRWVIRFDFDVTYNFGC